MALGNKVGYAPASKGLLADVDTVARNPLGLRQFDDLGNEYIYATGVASLAAGDWVVYNYATAFSPYLVSRMVSTPISGPVAVACAAILAAQFGWFQIYGLTPAFTNIATDATGDGKLIAQSATPGRATTGPVTTKNVFGAVIVGNPAANVGTAFITYPFCFGSATI